MIELKNVSVKYIEKYFTLMNVNVIFSENSFILGDINDGTHSLFRVLAKIDNDYSGDVIIDDNNIKNIKDKNLDIAYIPSKPYLFKFKSIFDNLYYPLKIRKIKKANASKIINPCIEKYLKSFPLKIKNMNITEQKIITLVRALVRKPKYVLIEDLFDNIDERYIDLINSILTELSNNSIIISSEKKISPSYKNYKKYILSFGILTK